MWAVHAARSIPALTGAAIALLILAWVFANPPGTGPDEPAHYVRAIGAGGGHLLGDEYVPTAEERAAFERLGRGGASRGDGPVTGDSVLWSAELTRTFPVPRKLGAVPFGCNAQRSTESAACLDQQRTAERRTVLISNTGAYQPFAYVLPGLAMRAGGDPVAGLRLGRLAGAAIATLLLLLALAALASPRHPALSVAGFAAALTPMAIFSTSLLNASGAEVAGAILAAAALLRLTREEPAPRWVWFALTAATAALVLSRFFGPVTLAVVAVAVAVARPPGRLRAAFARDRGPATLFGAVAALAGAGGIAWQLLVMPHPETDLGRAADAVRPALAHLPSVLRQAIGNFGSLDTPLPVPVVAAWFAVLAGLLGAALWLGTRRERLGLLLLVGLALGLTVAIDVAERQTDFMVQGRHVLPLLVAIPLLAGEIVHGRAGRRLWPLAAAALAAAAAGQAVAFWANARRWAVGTDGPWLFLGDAEWSPPGGWVPWAVLVATAAALLAVAAARSADPGTSGDRSDATRAR